MSGQAEHPNDVVAITHPQIEGEGEAYRHAFHAVWADKGWKIDRVLRSHDGAFIEQQASGVPLHDAPIERPPVPGKGDTKDGGDTKAAQ